MKLEEIYLFVKNSTENTFIFHKFKKEVLHLSGQCSVRRINKNTGIFFFLA